MSDLFESLRSTNSILILLKLEVEKQFCTGLLVCASDDFEKIICSLPGPHGYSPELQRWFRSAGPGYGYDGA